MNYDRRFLLRSFLLIALVSIFHTTCTHEADISDLPEVCFTGDILPVFLNNCTMAGCHDGSGESEFSFRSYPEIMQGITPGDADASEIYKSIVSGWGERMPPDKPLAIEDRMKIRIWIDQGAAETTCPDGGNNTVVKRACFSRDIFPVIVSHCATSGCHDAVTREEGYNFTTYTNIRNAVRPGNPGESKIYDAITSNETDDKMPPAGSPQLTGAQVDSIRKWIIYGALNESCGEVCDTVNTVSFSSVISPILESTCTGCHSGSAPSGQVNLSSYSGVSSVASTGLLLKSLKGEGVPKMPPSGSLSPCRLRQFELWISSGYQNN